MKEYNWQLSKKYVHGNNDSLCVYILCWQKYNFYSTKNKTLFGNDGGKFSELPPSLFQKKGVVLGRIDELSIVSKLARTAVQSIESLRIKEKILSIK